MTDGVRYPFPDPPDFGQPLAVAPGIAWLRLPLPMKLDHVNCWILDEDDGVTVVDTGFDSRRTRALWKQALDGRRVVRVIGTHHHPDHIGLAGWFQAEGAELWMARTGWLMARMLRLDEQDRPPPETVAFWVASGMDPAVLAERLEERPFNFADVVAPMPLGYRRLAEGATVTAGRRRWGVRMGGGHAPEHVTLWSEDGALVLGGDQLLPSISPNIGVYATEPEADPLADWLETCARLAPCARKDHLVLPGHKLPFTGLPLRLEQLAGNHHGALGRLEAHLEQPRAAGDCFMPLFRREVGPGEYGHALVESMAHCLHLWHAGRATRTVRDDGAWMFRAVT